MAKSSEVIIDADILARYAVGQLLGKGSYGTVYAAEEKKTHKRVAIKIMPKEKLGSKGLVSVRNEITVMTLLQHPQILRLHQAIYSTQNVSLVLDHIEGGEVFQHLLKLKHYSERTSAGVMRNLMNAIKYMHSEGICHRDLKPDNLLLVEKPTSTKEVTQIKVADFGFATKFRGEVLKQPCGTPYYIAPEILQVGVYKTRVSYTETCDMWSAGVIAFILLAGYPPFNGRDKSALFKSIVSGNPDFSKPLWKTLSTECKDFVLKLLTVNPSCRMTAEQALKHPWLAAADEDETVPDRHLADSLENLKSFNAREKIKGAVFGVEATFRMMYLANCKSNKIKPNSSVVELLTATTGPLRHIDLKNNFLGPKGTETLVNIICNHTEVTSIDLTNALLDDELCSKVLVSLVKSSSKVHTLLLDNNPLITHATGRKILSLLQARKKLTKVSIEGTHISDTIKRKIRQQLQYNEELARVEKTLANKPHSAGEGTKRSALIVPGRPRPASGSSVVPSARHIATTSRFPPVNSRPVARRPQVRDQSPGR